MNALQIFNSSNTQSWFNNLIDLAKIILPAIITLLAGYLGYLYGLSRLRREKNLNLLKNN